MATPVHEALAVHTLPKWQEGSAMLEALIVQMARHGQQPRSEAGCLCVVPAMP